MIKTLEQQVRSNEILNCNIYILLINNSHLNSKEDNLFKRQDKIEGYIKNFDNELFNYYEIIEELSKTSDFEYKKIETFENKKSNSHNYLEQLSGVIDNEVDLFGRHVYLKFFKDIIENHNPPKKYIKWWKD